MTVSATLTRDLTDGEVTALSHYGADSTYLHAVAQQRERDFANDAGWNAFWPECGRIVGALDTAIGASVLDADSILYSAHGNGFGVRGSIRGSPAAYVGLEYCYPGYISTSAEPVFRDSFLGKRRNALSQPAILEFRLPAGFHAIDLRHGSHGGEFEFLLGRQLRLQIIDASLYDGDVLWLRLEP